MIGLDQNLKREIAQARAAIAILAGSVAAVEIDADDEAARCAMQLFATILELHSESTTLAEAGQGIGVPILFRSLYEAFIDLENLLCDRGYLEYLQVASFARLHALLAASISNPLLKGLGEKWDMQAELKRYGVRVKDLHRKGKYDLHIEKRCERVGRRAEYTSLYALFCMDAHNSLVALEDRHDAGDAISILQTPHGPTLANRLIFSTRYAYQAGVALHRAFRTENAAVDQAMRQFETDRQSGTATD